MYMVFYSMALGLIFNSITIRLESNSIVWEMLHTKRNGEGNGLMMKMITKIWTNLRIRKAKSLALIGSYSILCLVLPKWLGLE